MTPIPASETGLALRGVRAGYGRTVVLDGVTLALAPGATLSVLGRNGVGKTTLMSTIMGHTTLHGGTIGFGGSDITTLPTYGRCRRGIGFVPQEREIFPVADGRGKSLRRSYAPAAGRSNASTTSFRAWPNGARTAATSSPAASSRCSPSAAR